MIANVHSIETYSILDGPGIRYVLFLQGCNLTCKYCHNIDAVVKTSNKTMSVDEVVNDYFKYSMFYKNGGITVSGGEPLMQIDFLIKLFSKLKEKNVHTAIETQGTLYKDNEKFRKLIELTDLFIVDLKAVTNENAKAIANSKIDNTLKLLDKLNSLNKKFQVTYVLIPTINDSLNHAKGLSEILKKYKPNNYTFKALKYHKLGLDKWEKLGLVNELKDIREATKDDVERFIAVVKENLNIKD